MTASWLPPLKSCKKEVLRFNKKGTMPKMLKEKRKENKSDRLQQRKQLL